MFDPKYQSTVDNAKKEREKESKKTINGDYSDKSYINFLLPNEYKEESKQLYQVAKKEINEIEFDIDDDIKSLLTIATENGIVGYAENYINQL